MMTISTNELKKNRQDLIDQLNAFDGKILRGSIVESYKKCGKPGCKCATGSGHGPKHSMTINFPKRKPEHDYIPLEYVTQVKECVSNFHQVKKILEQICTINREILKRREEL
jgi:nitrogen regulatory protein PII